MEWQTTTTILQRLRESENQAAWHQLVDRFRLPIVRFARQLGVSSARAEDVAQETLLAFTQAFRDGRYVRDQGRLSSWLFGIAYRHVQRERRSAARNDAKVAHVSNSALDGMMPDEQSLTAIWERKWRESVLDQCIAKLRKEVEPTTFRAFQLVVRDAMSPTQAAQVLGVSKKTIYNAKHRALKRIRELQREFESVNGED